jgi:all-trans-retinol 13,14-reductase
MMLVLAIRLPSLLFVVLSWTFLLQRDNWPVLTPATAFTTHHRTLHSLTTTGNSRQRRPIHNSLLTNLLAATRHENQVTAPVDTRSGNPWTVHDQELLHRSFQRKYVPPDLDYIIVGSGIGGLWLGACLAKFNKTALVLEQHYTAGGLQHTFQVTTSPSSSTSNGSSTTSSSRTYEFIPGLHYIANLELCGPLYDMVATAPPRKIRYSRAGNSVAADAGRLCSHDLQVGDLPPMQVREGLENVRDELLRVFPQEQGAIDEFLRIMERAKWQAGQFATFKIFPRWLQWLLSQFICSNYMHYASLTTEQVLERITTDGRLKTVLSAFGGDLGESLSDGSFVMQAAVLGHVLEGCYYPEGGPIHFVRGLVPTIRNNGGDVLVNAKVEEIVLENGRAVGVKLAKSGYVVRSKHGVVSDAGIRTTLRKLLPREIVDGPLRRLNESVEASSGGISHVFTFVGLNAPTDELKLRSSSFYYIPWNDTNRDMDATAIQEFYRNTLLDPNVLDVSAGMVFCTAKDPVYSEATMPGLSTAIIFSEARAEHFEQFLVYESKDKKHLRKAEYQAAKDLIEAKMLRSLLTNFPHLEPYIDVVEVATPLTLLDFTMRTETLGLRHTPQRMTDMEIRPDCAVPGLYFTGQDIAFAGWAGALTGVSLFRRCRHEGCLADFQFLTVHSS